MKPRITYVLALLVMAAVALPAYGGASLLAHFPLNEGGTSAFAISTAGINTYVMEWGSAVPRPDTNPPGWNPWVDEGGGFSYITFVDSGNNNLLLQGDPNWYGTFGGSGALPDADRLNLRMEPAGAVEMWYRSNGAFKSSIMSHEGNGGAAGPGGGNIAGMAIGAGYTSAAGNIAGTLSGNQNGGSSNGQVGGTTHFATGIGDVASPIDVWTHVVLTWVENSHARLFLNGQQAGSDVALDFTPNLGLFRSHIGLDGTAGTGSNSGSFYPNADVDEVKFWQGEMPGSQALANFNAGRPVPEPAMLGLLSVSALLIWRRRLA